MSTVKTNKLVSNVIKEANKSEKDLLQEKATAFVENAIIEAELQIAMNKTGTLPQKELELKRANIDLKKAEANLLSMRFSMPVNSSFVSYTENIYKAKEQISNCKLVVETIKESITDIKATITSFESILADLQATI